MEKDLYKDPWTHKSRGKEYKARFQQSRQGMLHNKNNSAKIESEYYSVFRYTRLKQSTV
jgi:hypothetical protein